jgi:stress response protein YsnF
MEQKVLLRPESLQKAKDSLKFIEVCVGKQIIFGSRNTENGKIIVQLHICVWNK